MSRTDRARTPSAEVERVRALLSTMQNTRTARQTPGPAEAPARGRVPAGTYPDDGSSGPVAEQDAPASTSVSASQAVTAWAELSQTTATSTFEAHSRRTSGTIVCQPATEQEATACEPDPQKPSEAVAAVAAFLEALGTSTPCTPNEALASSAAPAPVARPAHRELSVPTSVAKAFGQQHRTFSSTAAFDDALERCLADCAWKRLLSMTGARERSAAHIERALRDEGFPRDVARTATQRARTCQLIDDARFAETFIRAKLRAGWGRQRIERALAQEGVDPSCAPGYPEEFFASDSEEQRAWAALQRKPIPERNPEQKLARFLAGRGFPPSLSLRLAHRRVSESQESQSS